MRTGRKFGKINSVFMTQEKFNSPDSRTSQSCRYLISHTLRFLQMFGINMCRLETFSIISSFLYMSDRRTEQSRTVFLSDGEQSYLTIELNKLLNNQFFDISTTAFTPIMPCLFQLIRALDQRLAFNG